MATLDFNHSFVVPVAIHQAIWLVLRIHFVNSISFDLFHLRVRILRRTFEAIARHVCALLGKAHVHKLKLLLLDGRLARRMEVLFLDDTVLILRRLRSHKQVLSQILVTLHRAVHNVAAYMHFLLFAF